MSVDKIVKTELHIRFSDGKLSDLVVPIANADELKKINNRYLRMLVRDKTPTLHNRTHNRRLRFIYNGRPVSDSINFQESLNSFNRLISDDSDDDDDDDDDDEFNNKGQTVQESLVSKSLKGKDKIPTESDSLQLYKKVRIHKIYIHCLIGDVLSKEELLKEDQLDAKVPETTTTPAPIGFDRLLNAGFSQNEVAELRQQFQSIYGSSLNQRNTNDLDEEFDDSDEEYADQNTRRYPTQMERANDVGTSSSVTVTTNNENDIRQLEERWIESSANDPTNLTDNTSTGFFGLGLAEQGDTNNRDLLIGVLLGSMFGVLSLFLLRNDYKLVNKRTRMAIVAGVFINFFFALIRQFS